MRMLWTRSVGIAAVCLLALGFGAWRAIVLLREPSLPYRDQFSRNNAEEWVPMGGDWQISDGAVFNRSDEDGAKLLTGSSDWTDYELTTDLELNGHAGDVGVMVRVGDEEPGVDSYNGYYVGLRSDDSVVVIGRADHGWMEGRPAAMPGGVQAGVWYQLRVVVVGCNIGAEATNLATAQTSWTVFEERPCVTHGKIGLRSMATGGAWRKVLLRHAVFADFAAIRSHASFVQTPVYPTREDEYNHMRESYFSSTFLPARSYRVANASGKAEGSSPPLQGSLHRFYEGIPIAPKYCETARCRHTHLSSLCAGQHWRHRRSACEADSPEPGR